MSEDHVISPRSPLESMDGWVHLPRLIDKIRLHAAGKLGADYQGNLMTTGFDAKWLEVAEVQGDEFRALVEKSVCDGEICDWIRKHVRKSERVKEAFKEHVITYGREGEDLRAKLQKRKEESGIGDRADIQCFVDYIDADEGRI